MRHSPHRWTYLARQHRVASVLVLERETTRHELDTFAPVELDARGTLAQCAECGCFAFWGHRVDTSGQRIEVSLFGVELDALTPSRTPRCERLSPDAEVAA